MIMYGSFAYSFIYSACKWAGESAGSRLDQPNQLSLFSTLKDDGRVLVLLFDILAANSKS